MIKELKELRKNLNEISTLIKGCHFNKYEISRAYSDVILARAYLNLVIKEIDSEYSDTDESERSWEFNEYKVKMNFIIKGLDNVLNSQIKYSLPEGLEPSRLIFFNQNYSRCLLEAKFWLEEELKSLAD